MAQLRISDKLLKVIGIPSGETKYDIDIYHQNHQYHENIKKINLDKWYYTNKKISYTHNEYGYRCDKLSDIKDNDYGLAFGCSHTYGTGLFYEDTYAYKVSKELGLKNINLAMPASGIKIQQYNTTLFVNNFVNIRLPKYVIYQYPHDHRVAFAKMDTTKINLESFGEITTIAPKDSRYIDYELTREYYLKNPGEKYMQDLLVPLYLNNIWKALDVPVYHITFDDYTQEYKSDYQDFEIENIREYGTDDYIERLYTKARDLSHGGINFNNYVYKIILNKIKNG